MEPTSAAPGTVILEMVCKLLLWQQSLKAQSVAGSLCTWTWMPVLLFSPTEVDILPLRTSQISCCFNREMVNEPMFVFVDWSFDNYLPHCMTASEHLHISPYQRAFAEWSISRPEIKKEGAGPRPVEVRSEDGPPVISVLTDSVALVLRLIVVKLTWLEEFWILLLNISFVVIKLSDLQCPWFQVLVWLLCLSKLSMAIKRLGTVLVRSLSAVTWLKEHNGSETCSVLDSI